MQETVTQTGFFEVNGTLAYVEQEPLIFLGTLKDNILFENIYNEDKMTKVIKVCQLESDLLQLSNGINTQIGERGINISGGQKARLALARAVYSDADILLLDDPLSAVDPHVAHAIFNECIVGYLKNKCVILATHQLQFLKEVDKILVLNKGEQLQMGNY